MSLLVWALLGASAFDQTFERGVEAYERGRYTESIAAFEHLVDQGVVDPALFYNLGNAYYRNGQLAPAIAYYERALQLNPGLRNAQENLRRAVAQTERAMSRPQPSEWEQSLFSWHFGLSRRASASVALVFWALGWVLLSVRLLRPWPYFRRAATAALVIALVFGVSWWLKADPPMLAVASEPRVPVRYGTRAEEAVRFELYEGDRVLIDARKNGWVRVVTSGGERGWASAHQLLFVGPPFVSFQADRSGDAELSAARVPAEADNGSAMRALTGSGVPAEHDE